MNGGTRLALDYGPRKVAALTDDMMSINIIGIAWKGRR